MMATWVDPVDSQTDPDAPLTSALAKRWDNNLIAMAEGAPGAPRIRGMAAEQLPNMPTLSVTASNAHNISRLINTVIGTTTTTGTSFVVAATITIVKVSGTVRFKATQSNGTQDNTGTNEARILKNGSVVSSWTLSGRGATSTRSSDIPVSPGDIITWEIRRQSGGLTAFLTDPITTASDTYVDIPLLIPASEVL